MPISEIWLKTLPAILAVVAVSEKPNLYIALLSGRYKILDITVKRPGNGISPMQWYEIIGKYAKRNF